MANRGADTDSGLPEISLDNTAGMAEAFYSGVRAYQPFLPGMILPGERLRDMLPESCVAASSLQNLTDIIRMMRLPDYVETSSYGTLFRWALPRRAYFVTGFRRHIRMKAWEKCEAARLLRSFGIDTGSAEHPELVGSILTVRHHGPTEQENTNGCNER